MNGAAGVLIADHAGRILLVQPTYKPYWDIPGGRMEPGESPRACAQREVKEELGITVTPSRLLVVDYLPQRATRPEMTAYIFSVLEPDLVLFTLDPVEVRDCAWTGPRERDQMLQHAPILRRRVESALVAELTGLTSYLESGFTV